MKPYDLFFLVGAIALAWVTVFLCWTLYEIARLVRKSNQIVDETIQKIHGIEEAINGLIEKVQNPMTYLSLLAGGGKTLLSALQGSKKKKKSALLDDDDES